MKLEQVKPLGDLVLVQRCQKNEKDVFIPVLDGMPTTWVRWAVIRATGPRAAVYRGLHGCLVKCPEVCQGMRALADGILFIPESSLLAVAGGAVYKTQEN